MRTTALLGSQLAYAIADLEVSGSIPGSGQQGDWIFLKDIHNNNAEYGRLVLFHECVSKSTVSCRSRLS